MRAIPVSKKLFDRVFWTAMNLIPSEDVHELEVAIRILKKLKEVSSHSPSDEKDRVLDAPEHRFLFKEDERNVVEKKLLKSVPRFAGYVAEEVYELLQLVKGAEQVSEPPKDEIKG